MKVKLFEFVQGVDIYGALPDGKVVAVLEPGKTYDVNLTLGTWLLEHRKAEALATRPAPVKYEAPEVKLEPFPEPEAIPVDDPSEAETLPPQKITRRSRKAKHEKN